MNTALPCTIPQTGVVFHDGNGEGLDMDELAQRVIRPAVEAIRLPQYGWHGFRRGVASNLYELGANEKIVQRILRHANPHVTKERGFIAHDPDLSGVLQTQEWQGTFRVNFNYGAYTDDDIYDLIAQRITTPFNIYKNVVIPVGMYRWARHPLTYGSRQGRKFTWRLFERFGTYYNGHLNEARVRWS